MIFRLAVHTLLCCLGVSSKPFQGVFIGSNEDANQVGVYSIEDDGSLVWKAAYATGGAGYPEGQPTGANGISYHTWNGKQWLLASNRGGENKRPSMSIFEIDQDLTLTLKDVVNVVPDTWAASVTGYGNRACIVGTGTTVLVECFTIQEDGTLEPAWDYDLQVVIDIDIRFRGHSDAPTIQFSPDGTKLGLLFNGSVDKLFPFSRTPSDNRPTVIHDAGFYTFAVIEDGTYEDPQVATLDVFTRPYDFVWSPSSDQVWTVGLPPGIPGVLFPPYFQGNVLLIDVPADGGPPVLNDYFPYAFKAGCWIEYLNDKLYLSNFVVDNDLTILETDETGAVVNLTETPPVHFPFGGTPPVDVDLSGAKQDSGQQYLFAQLSEAFEMSSLKINADGSLTEVGRYAIASDGTTWTTNSGLATTRLSEQELVDMYRSTDVIGAVFSSTNVPFDDPLNPRGSHLQMYYQMADGLLAGPVGTFENGDAGIDFEGNQGSIQVSGDQVFVANGAINPATGARGEGSVSVFTFTKHGLTRTDNVPSGGPNPASFALCDNILYVANAALLGGFVGFIAAHPTISSTITALKVEDDGTLTYIEELTQDLGVGARPVDVQITPDKKYLVIPMSAAGEMRAYEVGNDCMLTGNFVSTTEGLLGPVAFSTAVWGGKNYVYVGNAGSGTVSAFVLDEENETLSFINSEVGPGEGAALCWTVIYGTYVYTANALTGTISSFEIDPADGSVKLLSEVAAVTGDLTIPQDMYIQNGKLYQLLGGNGNILVYDIDGGDGSLSLLQTFDADLPGSTTHRPGGLAAGYFDAPEYVQVVGNNGQPSSAFPLGKCQGDCDVDEECDGALVCFHRDGGDPVPGCLGGEKDKSRTDYCVSA